jgi:hypothetical protein
VSSVKTRTAGWIRHVDEGHAVHAARGADRHLRMEPIEGPLQQFLRAGVLEPFGGLLDPRGLLHEEGQRRLVDGFAFGHHWAPPIRRSWRSNVRAHDPQVHPASSAGRMSCSPQNGQ